MSTQKSVSFNSNFYKFKTNLFKKIDNMVVLDKKDRDRSKKNNLTIKIPYILEDSEVEELKEFYRVYKELQPKIIELERENKELKREIRQIYLKKNEATIEKLQSVVRGRQTRKKLKDISRRSSKREFKVGPSQLSRRSSNRKFKVQSSRTPI